MSAAHPGDTSSETLLDFLSVFVPSQSNSNNKSDPCARMGWSDDFELQVCSNAIALDQAIARALRALPAGTRPVTPLLGLPDGPVSIVITALGLGEALRLLTCSTGAFRTIAQLLPHLVPALRAYEAHLCLLDFVGSHPLSASPPCGRKDRVVGSEDATLRLLSHAMVSGSAAAGAPLFRMKHMIRSFADPTYDWADYKHQDDDIGVQLTPDIDPANGLLRRLCYKYSMYNCRDRLSGSFVTSLPGKHPLLSFEELRHHEYEQWFSSRFENSDWKVREISEADFLARCIWLPGDWQLLQQASRLDGHPFMDWQLLQQARYYYSRQ